MSRAGLFTLALGLLVPVVAGAQGLNIPFKSNRDLQDAPATETDSAPQASEAVAPEPLLRVDFAETETIPGQPLSLRLSVLVPTFMPDPPVWPSLEAPNLLVRLPEGATNPTSERIAGQTWSGITRHYRIAPMVPGTFALPPQAVIVTWNNEDSGAAERARLETEPITFSGVVPEEAADLDPFIAAAELTLNQTIEGTPSEMVPGDSFTRTVTATVEGVSPMFLPPLVSQVEISGLAAYADEPVVAEHDDRGQLSGTRSERTTYVAEAGGSGALPALTIDWYDIDDERVKTAQLELVAVAIDGPPAARAAPRVGRLLAVATAALVALAVVATVFARRLVPVLRRRMQARHSAFLASEAYAWRELNHVLASRDQRALRPALDLWAARIEGADPRTDADVQAALLRLGAARYGAGADSAAAQAGMVAPWRTLQRALVTARKTARQRRSGRALPPLNPTGAR
ncbi:MAG: hypothetical protein ACFB3T_16025 [Geminicoccaceae bacterium]